MVEPLLPIRHPDQDFYICDLSDVIPKSDIASMEHPLFTLSTRPDITPRHYEHNGNTVDIYPSVLGLATVHDKDVLIYCISQLMAGINQGQTPSRTVRFNARDLLMTTNRPTGGESYKRLSQAFARLAGTLIETNIRTNGVEINKKFHILDSVDALYKCPETKRMVKLEVTLSKWLYNSVLGQEVLSISPNYFRLRKPIERRLYEIARKHCGLQKQWQIGIENLRKKMGFASYVSKLKKAIKHLEEHKHLPDYSVRLVGDNVVFNYTGNTFSAPEENHFHLRTTTYEKAKKIVGKRFDVYALEYEWREWWKASGQPVLESPDAAFLGFCKYRANQ